MNGRSRTDEKRLGRWRATAIAVLPALLAGLVAACGSGGGGSGDGKVELRFAWWGSDTRHELTQQVIKKFEQSHPNIDVTGEFSSWESYWNKLSTQMAGGDAPDIIQMDWDYLREYGDRGALRDLSELVDTADIAEQVIATGEVEDTLYAVPAGINAYTLLADPVAFEEAGVEMPDDTTWTWDDYQRIATELSEKLPEGVYGSEDKGENETNLQIFARQRGQDLYAKDATLRVSEDVIKQWWQIGLDMLESGATPPASLSAEATALGPEQSLLATHKAAMGFWWTNQLTALTEASGRDLRLMRMPGGADGMYYKSSMFWSISSGTEHPEAAAKLVNFMLNDPAAVRILGSERGLPPNTKLLEQIQDELPEVDGRTAEFMTDIGDEVGPAPIAPPKGAGDVEAITQRLNTEVLFERITVDEAAAQLRKQVNGALEP